MKTEFSEIWNDVKVLVACNDYHGFVYNGAAESFASFMFEASSLIEAGRIVVMKENHVMVDLARCKSVWKALQSEHGFTHLFFFDADMTVSIDDLETLLERRVDIVSGTYFMRARKAAFTNGVLVPNEGFPCVAARDTKHITRAEISASDELIPVHSTGAGCLLVTTDALRNIGQPAFQFSFHVGGNHFSHIGEDQQFCLHAMKAGYTIWLDPTVRPDHFAVVRVGYEVKDFNNVPFYTPNY